MNRRHFLKLSGTGAAVAVLTPMTMLETGCTFSVEGTINVIIQAVGGILSFVGGSAPWVADLQAALTALQTAETQWKAGGAVALIIDALNTVEAVVAVIPFTMVYSPLIDIIVSGIEAVINFFAPQSMKFTRARATEQNNPHKGRVPLKTPGFAQTYQGAFKQQFNDAATGLGLSQLKIA